MPNHYSLMTTSGYLLWKSLFCDIVESAFSKTDKYEAAVFSGLEATISGSFKQKWCSESGHKENILWCDTILEVC